LLELDGKRSQKGYASVKFDKALKGSARRSKLAGIAAVGQCIKAGWRMEICLEQGQSETRRQGCTVEVENDRNQTAGNDGSWVRRGIGPWSIPK
jgi:hypothetical protein